MAFRLDPDLRAAFLAACEGNDRSAAQELRGFMRGYVEKHGQGSLPFAGESPKAGRNGRPGRSAAKP